MSSIIYVLSNAAMPRFNGRGLVELYEELHAGRYLPPNCAARSTGTIAKTADGTANPYFAATHIP